MVAIYVLKRRRRQRGIAGSFWVPARTSFLTFAESVEHAVEIAVAVQTVLGFPAFVCDWRLSAPPTLDRI